MDTNNLLSQATGTMSVKNRKYYVVEMQWFRRAFPVLNGQPGTRESLGPIHNERLYDPNSSLVCAQYEHGVDYVLVGPNVWLLLSRKFVFDQQIAAPVVFNAEAAGCRVWLQLSASATIPLLGRFPYEKYLESPSQNNDTVVSDDPTVGEDDYDEMDTYQQMESGTLSPTGDPILLLPPPETKIIRRRYGSGLGSMGNTCFMNSTLQCLAHTEPLKRYFLSGEYRQDLNRSNPLGTGGDLATEFSALLGEMWTGDKPVVYPRQFKVTLGKHAEQFVGYDQHDSQELATYLLDALHEDCNRVTQKPYFEKPEQGPNETDEEAADKAWNLHLSRDDSRVLDNFMGQVKSRLECPDCSRVSTTFDPFMFLSVPVPGSEMRKLKVFYVPLNPRRRTVQMDVKIAKLATIADLVKAAFALRKEDGFQVPASTEDAVVADVFKRDVWAWLQHESAIDAIKDTDVTYIYELTSSKELEETNHNPPLSSEDADIELLPSQRKLDFATTTRLNSVDNWMNELQKYCWSTLPLEHAMNPRSGTTEDRVRFYRRLTAFIRDCHSAEPPKRTREEMEDEGTVSLGTICSKSTQFKGVRTEQDLAIIEHVARKLYFEIKRLESLQAEAEDVVVEVKLRNRSTVLGDPFAVRIAQDTTVHELRQLIYHRLERCFCNEKPSAGEPTAESSPCPDDPMRYMLEMPLWYERNRRSGGKTFKKQMGSVPESNLTCLKEDVVTADPSHKEEQVKVWTLCGNEGRIYLDFSDETFANFNETEFFKFDERPTPQDHAESEKNLSVYDCIEKYCTREQLEESEQWYCSQCKDRVCAWKQIEIFRCPPHLIVHLKRFQFSASSHRRQKISTFIDFPLEGLDLRNHVAHYLAGEEPIYDCYAVSNHFGGLGGGHYTAYALNEGNVWCNYDDSRITENVNPQEVVSDAAYVLYYRRRDVPTEQEYEVDLTTSDTTMAPAKVPAVITDSHSRPSSWTSSQLISSDAAMVDDEGSTTSDGAVSGYRPAEDYDRDDPDWANTGHLLEQ